MLIRGWDGHRDSPGSAWAFANAHFLQGPIETTGAVEVMFILGHVNLGYIFASDEAVRNTHADVLSPVTDATVRVAIGVILAFKLCRGQHGGVQVRKVLDHGYEVAVLGVELPYLLFVLLVPS